MAHTRTQRRENELPYIPFGPFQIRLPFIHYKIESVEFIQGLILGVTALAYLFLFFFTKRASRIPTMVTAMFRRRIILGALLPPTLVMYPARLKIV